MKHQIYILNESENLRDLAKTGVSLHCHSEHSRESMDFIPNYAEKLPIISHLWKKEKEKYLRKEGREIDFSTAYWSPPLPAKEVYECEKKQIEGLGLDALVSITDHDTIQPNFISNEGVDYEKKPISLEWTVPYEYGFFHVGVHNLPETNADDITKTLIDFTFGKDKENDKETLNELFSMLNDLEGVLLVLNHPIWDIEMVGQDRHEILLKNFIGECGKWIHAFEVNGYRSWSENKRVIEMAKALGFPITTGGDRHGCQANTVFNLTDSDTFSGFVEEIRVYKRSRIVMTQEYKKPLPYRQLQSLNEILKTYPEFPESRKRWFDRVFYDNGGNDGVMPLSSQGWNLGGPIWLRRAIRMLELLESPKVRPIFSILRNKKDRVPINVENAQFEIPNLDELMEMLNAARTRFN